MSHSVDWPWLKQRLTYAAEQFQVVVHLDLPRTTEFSRHEPSWQRRIHASLCRYRQLGPDNPAMLGAGYREVSRRVWRLRPVFDPLGGTRARLGSAARRPRSPVGAGRGTCFNVCAGPRVVRTVSVAVRTIRRLGARGHGHIADRVRVGADGAHNRLLSRTVTASGCRRAHRETP